MKRTVTMLVLLALVSVAGFAQLRADLGITIPWRLGATVVHAVGDPESESLDVLSHITLLLPEATVAYEARFGPVNLGVGLRGLTLIIESLAYPVAFVELETGSVAINANIGGGAFLFFGVFNHLQTARLVIPDLSAYLKVGDVFRAGVGIAAFVTPDVAEALPFVVYLSGKFIVRS